MYQSKLFDIISAFHQAKINNFNHYLNIYRQKKENAVIRLFDYIFEQFPSLDSPKLAKEQVHGVLYPDKEYDEKRMLNTMSDLLRLAEEFISYQASRENKLENSLHLLQFYLENDLNKQFESTFKETKLSIEQMPENTASLIISYRMELLHVEYQLKYDKRNCDYHDCRIALNNLVVSQQKKLDNLYNINLYNDHDSTLVSSKLAQMQDMLHYLLLNDNNTELYSEAKTLLTKEAKRFTKDELLFMVIIFINHCIRKVNEKIESYNQELLYWYDFLITYNCILEVNDTISSATVKNYITISLRLNQLQKADDFLEKYASVLSETEKEDVYNYNKANILFHQFNYEESLLLLSTIKYKDIFYKLSAKRLYIKIYYALTITNEKRYSDVMDSSLNAFKKYIYTTKEITESIRTRNKSFYKYSAKLANLHKGEQKKLEQLHKEITQDTECADRDWLLEKISILLH
ncbi:MAG TPA: hypothetical protein PKO18_00230 [Chitinophagales bacterium]|nr:hypothetical protein [Chitinophagales bacterium]HNL83627.1 hypothetical protein [Chitinophagales bacterium]